MCVLCERKIVNSKSTYVPPHTLASSYPHSLTASHIKYTIIEAINSCLEVMQENSRSHVPCEEGRERGERGEKRGSGGGGVEGEGVRRRTCRVT